MIASERTLTSPHQPQSKPKQRRQPPTTTKNGIKKPIRPVKVYVIDPRKFRKQLEACASKTKEKEAQTETDQKDKVEGETNTSKSKTCDKGSKNGTHRVVFSSDASTQSATTQTSSIASNPNVSNFLPPLVPKFATTLSSIPVSQTQVTVSQEGATVPVPMMGNGFPIQCISTAGFVPALPLVVTNGIALLQPQIGQSSIPTGGIFLPGVAAIPGVNGAYIPNISNGATILGGQTPAAQPKSKSKKKKPKKKKKVVKKKKPIVKKDEEEDDSELTYLMKETTTRTGRISRPVSQPLSPPRAKENLEITGGTETQAEPTASSESCQENIVSQESSSYAHHFEVPLSSENNATEIVPRTSIESQSEAIPSTNNQGPTTVPIPRSVLESEIVQSTTFSSAPPTSSSTSSSASTPIIIDRVSVEKIRVPFVGNPNPSIPVSNFDLSLPCPSTIRLVTRACPTTTSAEAYSCVQYSSVSTVTTNLSVVPSTTSVLSNEYFSSTGIPTTRPESLVKNGRPLENCTSGFSTGGIESKTSISSSTAASSSSLVPTYEGPPSVQFQNSDQQKLSNVNVVPSSYSIPSSPPSQIHSPGFPDQVVQIVSYPAKVGGSPRRSPVDPMLLRCRSPFPPPMHPEISLPSVSISNLTIPEESLCRGELFMDLGVGGLDNASPGRASLFCPDSMGPIFPNSPEKPSPVNEQSNEGEADEQSERDEATPAAPKSPLVPVPALMETTEDANDGEIFQKANYVTNVFIPPIMTDANNALDSSPSAAGQMNELGDARNLSEDDKSTPAIGGSVNVENGQQAMDVSKSPLSCLVESDLSMDSVETTEQSQSEQKRRSIWQFVKDQIKHRGISQACGEISEVAEKLSRIARDQFIPIREDEIERFSSTAPIIQVDTPFFSHLLDLPFGTYIFKEDAGRRKELPPPPPPISSSELSFTCGVEDVEKFLPPDLDLISLPHLTNLDLN